VRLGKTYSNERLEEASKRALELDACSYQSLKSILKRSLDRQTSLPLEPERSGPRLRIFAGLSTQLGNQCFRSFGWRAGWLAIKRRIVSHLRPSRNGVAGDHSPQFGLVLNNLVGNAQTEERLRCDFASDGARRASLV
jgi:hypothetical protein